MFNPYKIHSVYFCLDIILILAAFFGPYLMWVNDYSFSGIDLDKLLASNLREYAFIFAAWMILILNGFKRRNLYYTDRNLTIPREIYQVLAAILSASLIIVSVIFFLQFKFFSRAVFISSVILLGFLLSLWRIIKRNVVRRLIAKGFNNFNVLMIEINSITELLIAEIRAHPFLGLRMVGILDSAHQERDFQGVPILGGLNDLEKICKQHFIDEVFITASSQDDKVAKITQTANGLHVGVRMVPANYDKASAVIDVNYVGMVPLLTFKQRQAHPAEIVAKRVFDVAAALLCLLLLSPFFLIIGLLIKIDSPGPVLYVQTRMGRKGESFNLYKFRSMIKYADASKDRLLGRNEVKDGVIFKMRLDPRITRLGRILRRYSLDELPQLFNVLKGDMSIVGPRPFPIEESRKMKYNHMPRLNIKPGITGLAQVKGRSDLTFYRWVRWDLWYLNNYSLGLDLKIIWWTLHSVVAGNGAY